MKMKIIKPYPDKTLKRTVLKDEVIEVDAKRGKELVKAGVAIEEKQAALFGEETNGFSTNTR